MPTRVLLISVLAVIFFLTEALAADPDAATIKSEIDRFIKSATNRYKENQMDASARKHIVGDVNGDGNGDVVLLYDLLSPTFGYSKLAVFVADKGKLKMAHEIDLSGEADLDAVKNGKILVSGKTSGPKDPRCCPSVAYKKTYAWKGTKLVETKP
jgi:hypothetical protein